MQAASRRCLRSGIVWSEAVTTTDVGTSTPAIQGAELNRPSSASTSGIDHALVLRNSALPQVAGSAISRDGSRQRRGQPLDPGQRDPGQRVHRGGETGKKNRSRVAPR